MSKVVRRKNSGLAKWLRAIAIGAFGWMGMAALQAGPAWLPAVVGFAAGVIALGNAEIGVWLSLVAFIVPVLAVNPIAGIVLAILLFSAERYLGAAGARPYVLMGLAFVGVHFGPAWAAAGLAGYLLGPADGAVASAAACIAVEVAGLLSGHGPTLGIAEFLSGGGPGTSAALVKAPSSLFAGDWIAKSFATISGKGVNETIARISHASSPAALFLQPLVWAGAAIVGGLLWRRLRQSGSGWQAPAAVSAGVGVAWLGDAVVKIGLRLPFGAGGSVLALVASLAVACVWAFVRETVFAPLPAEIPAAAPIRPSMAAEDADVDELLRLISTAEDQLAAKHTTNRVVLITDMKSFSRMTEEDGSVASAKAIQRHRDILVPIISANHGCGKSTGGDGVVAAFESAADAVKAAVEGQRALGAHNGSHPNEREISVRMGLASGEVVLDNGGRPFIGAALNLAARVMNLADGGQIFMVSDLAAEPAPEGAEFVSLGSYELKNIARPVDVVEVRLRAEGTAAAS
jgi:class 3 adenylate cyclase